MAWLSPVFSFVRALWDCICEVALFWLTKVYSSLWRRSEEQLLLETLQNARVFEEWEAAAYQLDAVSGDNEVWRQEMPSRDYDYNLILARTNQTAEALEEQNVHAVVHILRSGLVRNLGNITSPKLYSCAYAGTKLLIEDYVTQVAMAIQEVTAYPTSHTHETGLSTQQKMDMLHDARQAFGRTCLVLQGGSIFGMCHIGVVKALHLRGLLPRIITGTATGALMAALVCVHTNEELLAFLSGEAIDLSAFAAVSEKEAGGPHLYAGRPEWLATLLRRTNRFLKYGYMLDVKVLEDCVRANVGDLTFEEAYHHTKRILNITISPNSGGAPSLLNYLTAPNVLIWSAALASNASDTSFSPITLQCKTPDGAIVPWDISTDASFWPAKSKYGRTPSTDHDRDTPLSRVAELFNVNHFVVSQARPYIAPFLAPSLHHSHSARTSRVPWSTRVMHLIIMELQHRLTQMDMLGWLEPGIRRLLLDESVPGSSWTLVPQVSLSDFARLLRNPTKEEIDYWILRGERSVWPAVCALKIRYVVEAELDRGYQLARRRKPLDITPVQDELRKAASEKQNTKRPRAASMGAG